jgi:hypothetical protein
LTSRFSFKSILGMFAFWHKSSQFELLAPITDAKQHCSGNNQNKKSRIFPTEGGAMSAQYTTSFSSINSYEKGGVQIIDDDLKNFVFSNIYEVAATHKPYERIVVGKNLDYTLEAVRAEGTSPWYACAHDEFVVAMDHNVEVHFMELNDTSKIDDEQDGSFKITGQPLGKKIGMVTLSRGHMAMLPEKTAYQFQAAKPSTLLLQTILGQESLERWTDICLK